jgi:hypothetical protein
MAYAALKPPTLLQPLEDAHAAIEAALAGARRRVRTNEGSER